MKDLISLSAMYFGVLNIMNNITDNYVPIHNKSGVAPVILQGYDVINNKTNVDYGSRQYSMWFSETNRTSFDKLTSDSQRNLELSVNLDILGFVFTDFDHSLVNSLQYEFIDGFYYVHPASNTMNLKEKLIPDCVYNAYDVNKIDARCLISFQSMKSDFATRKNAGMIDEDLIVINAPNLIMNGSGILNAEFCSAVLDPLKDLQAVLCIDYSFRGE